MQLSVHNLLRKLGVALGVAAYAACSGLAIAQSEMDLPDIGNPAGTYLTRDDEYGLGLMVMRQLRDQNAILEDPESAEYIQSLGSRLAAQGPEMAHQFQYFVVNEADINAEALPGGFIVCDYGTILASESESQLAGVLAHETAHVTQRHIARAIQAQSHQTLAAAAAMLAAILIGAAGGGGPAIEGGIAAAQGMAAQAQINFTRGEENEADRVGMEYLSKAGFDPEGMPDFFETLSRAYGYEEGLIPKFLLDHPVTSDRIADARARAAHMERPRNLKDSEDYSLIRERLRVITASEDYDILGYYRKEMESGTPSLADQYGEAVALIERRRPIEAVDILKPLVAQHQGLILLRTALGQAQVAAGQVQDGLATFARAETLFPRNVPLTVRYGEALIRTGHAKEAHELLLDLFNNVEPTPRQIELTAQAASAAGDTGDAYYYMGYYHIMNGNLPLASHQLELALAAPNLNNVQRLRIQAQLDEVRQYILEQRRENHGRASGDEGGGHLDFQDGSSGR